MGLRASVLTITMMVSSLGWSRTVDQITCGQGGQNWTNFAVSDDYHNVGNMAFNYSTARLACPMGLVERLKKNGHIKCHGTWDWDFDRTTGHSIDTLAWISIQSQDGSLYGQFQTSASYGSRNIKVKCKLQKIELKDEE